MSRRRGALLAVLAWVVAAALAPACYGGQEDSGAAAPDLSALARQAMPAVGVLVTFDADGEPLSQGTAFFVRADGVGLTCHHVLSDAASALVRMEDGDFFPVEGKLAADPARDLALFKVAGKNLPTVSLGDSSALRPGQRVVAVTAPEGLENTVTDGLVSAIRELPSGPVVQVSVPLSSGSSGGPIFDLSGKVVAVAAAVLTEGQALNFAIPINAAKPLLAQPGQVRPLAPAKEPADLADWLWQRPTSPAHVKAFGLWLMAWQAKLDGHEEEAVGHLRAALVMDPTLAVAYCCLGKTCHVLGRYREAVNALKQAIRLQPDYADAYQGLGLAYCQLGRYQEAVEAFKQAVRLKPDKALWHYLLGLTYAVELGRWQDALEAFKKAIRLMPDDAYAHMSLGRAYSELGRHQDAVEAFKQAIRLKPGYAEAHFELGSAQAVLGRSHEAYAAYREAIRLKPDYAKAYVFLGGVCQQLGLYHEELAAYQQAIRLEPEKAASHYLLGMAYGNLRRYQEAIAALKQAIRLKPDFAEARYALELIYEIVR